MVVAEQRLRLANPVSSVVVKGAPVGVREAESRVPSGSGVGALVERRDRSSAEKHDQGKGPALVACPCAVRAPRAVRGRYLAILVLVGSGCEVAFQLLLSGNVLEPLPSSADKKRPIVTLAWS